MSLSADTVFHFTSSRERLIGILEDTFKPRYCWEDIATLTTHDLKQAPHAAFPMVCFCDIPLSQVLDHSTTYGKYGIGLKKEWAIKNGINPVFYVKPGTIPSLAIRDIADTMTAAPIPSKEEKEVAERYVKGMKGLISVGLYTKSYDGRLFRNGQYENKKIKFYDEREWRYVPDLESLAKLKLSVSKPWNEHLKNTTEIDSWNKILGSNCCLGFTPDDIKYLIVSTESEILDMSHEVDRIKEKFSKDQKNLLKTRLISMEQIASDF